MLSLLDLFTFPLAEVSIRLLESRGEGEETSLFINSRPMFFSNE